MTMVWALMRVVLAEIYQEEKKKKKKRSVEMTKVQYMIDCGEVERLKKQMIELVVVVDLMVMMTRAMW